MITRSRYLLYAVLLCSVTGAAFGADALEVARRVQEADRYVSYRGMKTASILWGDDIVKAVLKVVHLKPDKTRTEYFQPSMLAGVVTLQIGSEMWRYIPSERAWEPIRCPCPIAQQVLYKDLLKNYDLSLVGADEIAGRPTYVLYAQPRRNGEPARRLWIDREYYLVIGTQTERPSGKILNRSCYTFIEFEPQDISPDIFVVSGKVKNTFKPVAETPFKIFKPTYVPKGYRLIGEFSFTIGSITCSQLQYSNGANTISLFQRRAESPYAPKIDGKLLNVYTWTHRGMRMTLVGSISDAELRKMAQSVR